jgi:hypothetical protein
VCVALLLLSCGGVTEHALLGDAPPKQGRQHIPWHRCRNITSKGQEPQQDRTEERLDAIVATVTYEVSEGLQLPRETDTIQGCINLCL